MSSSPPSKKRPPGNHLRAILAKAQQDHALAQESEQRFVDTDRAAFYARLDELFALDSPLLSYLVDVSERCSSLDETEMVFRVVSVASTSAIRIHTLAEHTHWTGEYVLAGIRTPLDTETGVHILDLLCAAFGESSVSFSVKPRVCIDFTLEWDL